MGDRTRFRSVLFIPVLLGFLVFLGWPPGGYASHDLSHDCYACHNIQTGLVWPGSHSIWSSTPIGMPSYSRPITCDICHSDYGNRFKSTSESHHPVAVIAAATMSSDYDNGVVVRCKDCHNADSVTTLIPNLFPDLAPTHYDNTSGNDNTDGYPDHDVLAPNNQVVPGDPPHLLSMLLSAGKRTVSGSSTYNRVPSSSPATAYAFCLSCHDGSANTARTVNVRQDYIDKGHYFKSTGGGITAGDRIPCSDCHASHNSPTNARLFEPDNTTFTGTRPTGLSYVSPYAPTNAESRAICIFCHNDTASSGPGYIPGPYVRGVEPSIAPSTIPDHITYTGTKTTAKCTTCHNPHKTPAGGPDCLTCHTTGGAAGARTDYIDALFKGVGSDNGTNQPAASGSLIWSQHGGFVSVGGRANFLYTSPYNTKALNDCFKCHGDRHSNAYQLIDADTVDAYIYDPALGMQDNTAAGIVNANAFCLTCHDGNGAASDVQIGVQVPPNVAANWAVSGHGRPQASGAYPVSGNSPAYVKCISCHEVHGSNHAKLLPAKKNEITVNFTIPSNFPEKTFRSGGSTLLARDVDFTDYSSPSSGKGYGTTGDPGNQHAPPAASTGLCDACHRFAGRANGGTDNVTNRAHTHEGIVGDTNQDSASQMTFTKDCLECHDTHGTTNIEMVDTTINGYALTFTARTGANSFDNVGSGNSVCNVCHEWSGAPGPPPLNVDHNYRTWPAAGDTNPEHNPGTNCASCHSHGNASNAAKFGFPQAGCTSCHGYPPPAAPFSGTTVSWAAVDNVLRPSTVGLHDNHVSSYGLSSCNTTCHVSGTHATNKTSANMGVAGNPGTGVFQYSTVPSYAVWDNGGTAGKDNVVDDHCNNVLCHNSTYGTPANVYRSAANPGYTRYWIDNASWDCYTCHAYDGEAPRTPPGPAEQIQTGSHGMHLSSMYSYYTCARCHSVGTYTVNHKNGFVDWSFAGSPNPYPSVTPTYSGSPNGGAAPFVPTDNSASSARAYGACTNVYCHSTVQTSPPGGPPTYKSVTWGNAASVQCDSCHDGDGYGAGSHSTFTPMQTGTHLAHIDNAAYAISCETCHSSTGSCTPCHSMGFGPSIHADGIIQVPMGSATWRTFTLTDASTIFDRPTVQGVDNSNKVPGTAYGGCSNIPCHTDGNGGPPLVARAVWGDNTTNSARVRDCTYCHGGNSSSSASISTGSHAKHIGLYKCSACHRATVPANSDNVVAAYDNHINGVKNVLQGDGYTFTYTAGTPFGSCATISCHGGNGATWGGASLSCSSCHVGTGDINDFGTGTAASIFNNGITSRIDNTEWLAAGHGRPTASGNYPGPASNPPANFLGPSSDPNGCAYCHDFSVVHGVLSNPFRLANRLTSAAPDNGWNNVCLVCHKTGDAGYDPDNTAAGYALINATSNVDNNHYGNKHTAASKGGTFCWDCHDPHGDANHLMIHSGDGTGAGKGVTDVSDGALGIPVTSRTVTGLDVVTGGYTSADLANSSNTGLCQTCHAANGTSGGAAYYNRTLFTPLASHNGADTALCTSCHTHRNSFSAGCTSCHGYPPPAAPFAGTTVSWTKVDNASVPASVGLHDNHVSSYGLSSCNTTCHVSGTHATNKTSANMGVAGNPGTGVFQYSTVPSYAVWDNGGTAGKDNVVDDHCNNVLCHNSTYGSPADVYKSPANPSYIRYWNRSLDCYSCHAYNGTTASSNGRPILDVMGSGSHTRHVSLSPGYRMACTDCHPSGGYSNSHKSGVVNFVTAFGATRITSPPVTLGGFYSTTVGGTTGVTPVPRENGNGYYCTNVYCHSGGEPRGPQSIAYVNTARWDNAATGACGTCHGVDGKSGTMTTNVHAKHAATSSYGYNCATCHYGLVSGSGATYAIADNVLHVNGRNDVSFAANEGTYADNTGGTTGPAGGLCSATYCHSQGLDWSAPYTGDNTAALVTADWDNNSTGCSFCHGNPPSYANNTQIKPGATAYQKKNSHTQHGSYTCDRCHYGTTRNGTTIDNASLHANKAFDLAANTGAGVTFTVTMQGNLTGDVYTPTTCATISCHGGNGATWGGASLSCSSCHVGAGDVDDFGTGTAASLYNNGITSRIDNTEWMYSGHGKASLTYDVSGHNAANFGRNANPNPCAYCHDPNIPHNTSTNPFRLVDQTGKTGYGADGWNATCLVCHSKSSPVPPGYDPDNTGTAYVLINSTDNGTRVDTAHYGSKHSAAKDGGIICWNCHDPHGDRIATGGNIYMIGKRVARQSDTTLGIPAGGNDNSNLMTPVFTAAATGTDYAKSASPFNGICQVCHDATVSHYTSTSGDGHNSGTRCTSCHTHNSNFEAKCVDCHDNNGAKLVPAPLVVWSGGGRTSPPNVTQGTYGSHLVATKAETFTTTTDWNVQCNKCHTGHGGTAQVPMPPTSWTDPSGRLTGKNMAQRLGLNDYAVDNGIWLGGTATSGSTEAQICWNCHDNSSNAVSEWGFNTKTTPTGYPVNYANIAPTNGDTNQESLNYGWIYTDNSATTKTSNWVTGGSGGTNPVHKDAYDNASVRLSKRITSVHSVSFDLTGQNSSVSSNVDGTGNVKWTTATLEGVQYLRCSYCHDVHDLNKAPGDAVAPTAPADNSSGKPFLRGSWIGNPYPPDIMPRAGYAYPSTGGPTTLGNRAFTQQVPMPRYVADSSAANSSRAKGGFFIDQNSGNPTSNAAMNTVDKTAGLCELCHGTDVNTMKFYTASKLWRTVSTNGHANSTLGGTGTGKANLFDASRGTIVSTFTQSNQGQHGMGNQDLVAYSSPGNPIPESNSVPWAGWFTSFQGNRVRNSGWFGGTVMGSTTKGTGDYTTWYVTAGGIGSHTGTAGGKAHDFTCSKCHTPHAAGLPALLITNCMDKTLATWSATTRGGVNTVGPNASPAARQARPNNCHRKEASGTDNTGWIRLAPGQRY